MTTQQHDLAVLIQEIRTAFNRLRSIAETMHADLEINPSMRAVLQALVLQAPQTVPDIAKVKGVSRQHVQKIANALIEAGYIKTEENPDHKRSALFRPTEAGERLFAEITARETTPMATLADALPADEVAAATRLLARLNGLLVKLETVSRTGD